MHHSSSNRQQWTETTLSFLRMHPRTANTLTYLRGPSPAVVVIKPCVLPKHGDTTVAQAQLPGAGLPGHVQVHLHGRNPGGRPARPVQAERRQLPVRRCGGREEKRILYVFVEIQDSKLEDLRLQFVGYEVRCSAVSLHSEGMASVFGTSCVGPSLA